MTGRLTRAPGAALLGAWPRRAADKVATIPADREAGASPEYVGRYVDEARGALTVSLRPGGLEATIS